MQSDALNEDPTPLSIQDTSPAESNCSCSLSHEDSSEDHSDASTDICPAQDDSSAVEVPTANIIYSQAAQAVRNHLDTIPQVFDKASHLLDKMQEAISTNSTATPSFKLFWELRQLLLPSFKNKTLAETQRSELWSRCSHLTAEARKVKHQIESQFSGVTEQVESAISQLEQQIAQIEQSAAETTSESLFPNFVFSNALLTNQKNYLHHQSHLALHNLLATRINSLRKDLTKMPMRLRDKSRFFQRLSAAGNQIFPLRKQLIQTISELFTADVGAFVDEHQTPSGIKGLCYDVKGEIKNLQTFAKYISINPATFAATRMQLSKLWDLTRETEKEIKKQKQEQDQQYHELETQLKEKVAAFVASHPEINAETPLENLSKEIKNLIDSIYQENLPRRMAKDLSMPVIQLQQKIDQLSETQRSSHQQLRNIERTKQLEANNAFKNEIRQLATSGSEISLESLQEQFSALSQQLAAKQKTNELSKQDLQEIQRSMRKAQDILRERTNASRLSLSADDSQRLQYLESMLQEALERRKLSKGQLEDYRKQNGLSGLDFAKAMMYTSLIEEERVVLAEIDSQVQQVNQEIAQLKGA